MLAFLKDLQTETDAQFIVTVDSWDDEEPTAPLTWTQVDTPSPDHDIQWCNGLPAAGPSILPGSEVTCLLDHQATVQANGKLKVFETYYLFGRHPVQAVALEITTRFEERPFGAALRVQAPTRAGTGIAGAAITRSRSKISWASATRSAGDSHPSQ